MLKCALSMDSNDYLALMVLKEKRLEIYLHSCLNVKYSVRCLHS